MSPAEAVRNVGCPDCGGVLDTRGARAVLNCAYCGGFFFSPEHREAAYMLPPTLSGPAAAEKVRHALKALKGALRDGENAFVVDASFRSGATLAGTTLQYIPFFRYSAIRVGTAPFKQESNVRSFTTTGDESGRPIVSEQIEIQYKLETKVVVSEVGMVLPAVDAGARRSELWGLKTLLNENMFISANALRAVPFQREKAEREGVVLNPFRSTADVLARCREMYHSQRKKTRAEVEGVQAGRPSSEITPQDRPLEGMSRLGIFQSTKMDHEEIQYATDILDDRVSIFYCPVWRVQLRHRGRRYEAFVDAARGEVVSLEARVAGSGRTPALLWKSLLYGILGGSGLWAVANTRPQVMGLAGLGVLALSWLLIREASRTPETTLPGVKVLNHEYFADNL